MFWSVVLIGLHVCLHTVEVVVRSQWRRTSESCRLHDRMRQQRCRNPNEKLKLAHHLSVKQTCCVVWTWFKIALESHNKLSWIFEVNNKLMIHNCRIKKQIKDVLLIIHIHGFFWVWRWALTHFILHSTALSIFTAGFVRNNPPRYLALLTTCHCFELGWWCTMWVFWLRCGGGRVWRGEQSGWLPGCHVSQGPSGMTPLPEHRYRQTHTHIHTHGITAHITMFKTIHYRGRQRWIRLKITLCSPDRWAALKMNQWCTVPQNNKQYDGCYCDE